MNNGGGGTLSGLGVTLTYGAGQPGGWLTPSLNTTTAPSLLYLSLSPASLVAGSYTATVGVAAATARNSPQTLSVGFSVSPCTVAPAIMPGAYLAIDPVATLGCAAFPPNPSATDSAEYLFVPVATSEAPNHVESFRLRGAAPAPVAPLGALHASPAPSVAARFHDHLRELERTRAYPGASGARMAAPPALAPPDTVGQRRTFKVLSTLTSTRLAAVGAIARSVGDHIVLYVDSTAPAGLTPADYDKMRSDFDTLLYAADTAAFGRESDVDGNGRVVVLMTGVVNRLVSAQECFNYGYVAGFFFGADIDPAGTQFNHAEVFYSIVADPAGTLSCPHSTSTVNRLTPVTFVHEFQHMISYNQHVLLRGGDAEELWLNEGLSHYAEERAGLAFLRAGNTARHCDHVLGDLYNFGVYLASPGAYALVDAQGIGGLPLRGAAWAFVRFLADQFAADTDFAASDAFTRKLVETAATGTANVAEATGLSFASLVERWALANWVSDLPGFTAPPSLRYTRWAFRTAFPALHTSCNGNLPATFPLEATASAGATAFREGSMASGSAGAYHRALQGPSGTGFSAFLSDGSGNQLTNTTIPRLAVLRIR